MLKEFLHEFRKPCDRENASESEGERVRLGGSTLEYFSMNAARDISRYSKRTNPFFTMPSFPEHIYYSSSECT